MARKSTKKTDYKPNGASPGPGHNSEPTEEQRQVLAIQWKGKLLAAEAKKDDAVAAIRNIRKQIKAELGADGVDLVKDMIALESDGGEAKIRAAMERQLRAARYMAVPLGSQFEMFEDRMPAEDRAHAEGKRDAMTDQPLRNPYDPSVPQHNSYAEGWHAGQTAKVEAQRKRDADVFDGAGPGPEEAAALAEVEAHGIGGAAASFQVN